MQPQDLLFERPLVLACLFALVPTSTAAAQGSAVFRETFDGLGSNALTSLESTRWESVVHTRGVETWFELEAMEAAHGLDASPPPATHTTSAYEGAVYLAKEHLMTAINSITYGLIYLTPNALADWSDGECVVRFDVSTLRTSRRDWIDLWLTPLEDNMILPLEEALPDLQGNPKRGLQFRMETWSTVYEGQPVDWSHFEAFRYDDFVETGYPVNVFGYEKELVPSPKKRETYELRISSTHLKFGLPAYDLWWIDRDIADLGYERAVLQFGHHSYNPLKEGTLAPIGHDPSLAGTGNPSANSWHWDNFEVSPATRFDMIRADRRFTTGSDPETVVFERPAPPESFLRFAALGETEVSLNGGPFVPALKQTGSREASGNYDEGQFSSYWMPIPEGTQTVDVRLTATGIWAEYKLETMAKNFSIWSLPIGGSGCAGTAGIVPFADHPTPDLGNASFALQLENALPTATALLALSRNEVESPLCGFGVALDAASAPAFFARTVDANGAASQPLPLPSNPNLLGVDLYAQWVVLDPQGAFPLLPGISLAMTPLRRILLQ